MTTKSNPQPLPTCPGCGMRPSWRMVPAGLELRCACDGMAVDFPPGTPGHVVQKVKDAMEQACRESFQDFLDMMVKPSTGTAQ